MIVTRRAANPAEQGEIVKKLSRAAGYRMESLDGELLLYNPAQTRLIALNPTAALVWQLCDGTRTQAEIAGLILEAYPEAGPAVEADIAGLIATLADAGAVESA